MRGELRAVRVSDDLLSVLVQLAVAAATVSVRVSVTSLSQSGSWATYPSPPPTPSLLHTLPLLLPSLSPSLSLFKQTHNFRHLKAKVVAQKKKEGKKQRSHKVKVVKDNTKLEQQVERQHTHTNTHTLAQPIWLHLFCVLPFMFVNVSRTEMSLSLHFTDTNICRWLQKQQLQSLSDKEQQQQRQQQQQKEFDNRSAIASCRIASQIYPCWAKFRDQLN